MEKTPNSPPIAALGLMSGTSVDGIDAALVRTDGETITAFGPAVTWAYPPELQQRIRSAFGRCDVGANDMRELAAALTDAHAAAVAHLLRHAPDAWSQVDVVGFHGQTLFHAPDRGITIQIGDGARLAQAVGCPVVSDFRTADVAAGGQGAPLVPVYHRALVDSWAARPDGAVAVLNLGGVGNVTVLASDGRMWACDTGPGNALIDDWVRQHTGAACDVDGVLARQGQPDVNWLRQVLDLPFFAAPPPKSLDRDAFAGCLPQHQGVADGAASLTHFTAASVARVVAVLPVRPVVWLVCGGGRRNPAIMAALRQHLATPVFAVEEVGWDGDALEAQAFGVLAVRHLRGLPQTFPGTTGVKHPLAGGRLSHPPGMPV